MTSEILLIESPNQLAGSELNHFCLSFRNSNYNIVTSSFETGVDCERLLQCFKDPKTYSTILDDPQATFRYISIQYANGSGAPVQIPIGVFGMSEKHSVRFPLLLNDFWRDFLMIKQTDFAFLCNISLFQEQYYARLISLREIFIQKVFSYYLGIGGPLTSAMAWDIRGEKSLTRRLATDLGFSRIEFLRSEIYASRSIDVQEWNYLKQCVLKWFEVFNNIVQQPKSNVHPNLPLLGRGFVDFGNTAF